jgi:hypothetical protein
MKFKAILTTTIAALLVLSAAICTSAQSGNSTKHKASAAKASSKQNEPAPASKQNERPTASVAPAVESPDASAAETPASPAQQIVIEHDADGRGRITFQRRDSDQSVVEPLALSTIALTRLTTLWNALRFLDSETNYQAERQYPHLGTMRLRMKHGARERVAEFNWTKDRDALALVTEYRRVADQALFVFDISLSRENQPLEAPKLIDRLDSLLKVGGLSDPQQLLPLLRELTADERLPLIARNHAGRVLKTLEKGIETNHK